MPGIFRKAEKSLSVVSRAYARKRGMARAVRCGQQDKYAMKENSRRAKMRFENSHIVAAAASAPVRKWAYGNDADARLTRICREISDRHRA